MNSIQETSKTQNGKTNDDWATRGNFWLKKTNPVPRYETKTNKRRKPHKPLVLSGHGIRFNVNSGTLLIKCGFTQYPQAREEYRFFPRDRMLPTRIVILDGDGSITLDALQWLSEQGVPLVQIDWQGVVSSVGGGTYAVNPGLVEHQLEMLKNGHGFEFSKSLILEKVQNAIATIKHISSNSSEAKSVIDKLKEQVVTLRSNPPKNLSALLVIEGMAAASYFRYWYSLSLRWRGIGRKPIPEDWKQIGARIGSTGKNNRWALHPVNAILNYAYGVLENQVRGLILTVGADPSIGYMHSNTRSNAALVYDLMEPVRPIVDKQILEFVLNRTFSPDDFILNKNGVVRLHPQMARFVVKFVQDIPEIEKITNRNLNKLFGR